jgi:hypothetical protein
MVAGSCLRARPHDAPRRNAGKFFGEVEFEGESVSIRADGAAHDARAKLVASMASGILPGPVVGHRPFDRKEPLVVTTDEDDAPTMVRCGTVMQDRLPSRSYRCVHRVFGEKEPLIEVGDDKENGAGCTVATGLAPCSRRRRNRGPPRKATHAPGRLGAAGVERQDGGPCPEPPA